MVTLGIVAILVLVSSGDEKNLKSSASNSSKLSCALSEVAHENKRIETEKLPQGSEVIIAEGAVGQKNTCKDDAGNIIREEVESEAVDSLTLIGTALLPIGYDGNYDSDIVRRDYNSNGGQLSRDYFGEYTPPKPVLYYAEPAPQRVSGSDVYYANCSAARAAGAAPIYRGQPGYRAKLDRDGDGIACE